MVPEGRFKVSIHKTLMQPCLGEQTFDTNTEHEERRPCLLQTLATSPRVQPLLPFSTSQQDPGLPLVPVFLVAPHVSAPPWPRGKSPGILSQLCLPRVTRGEAVGVACSLSEGVPLCWDLERGLSPNYAPIAHTPWLFSYPHIFLNLLIQSLTDTHLLCNLLAQDSMLGTGQCTHS